MNIMGILVGTTIFLLLASIGIPLLFLLVLAIFLYATGEAMENY